MKPLSLLFLGACVCLLAACINLDPQEPPTRYYLLNAPEREVSPQGPEAVRLLIDRVRVPKYLRGERIALRDGAHEIRYQTWERWASGLEEQVANTLADTLTDRAPFGSVALTPTFERSLYPYVLEVTLLAFEGSVTGEVRLQADWQLYAPADASRSLSGHFSATAAWETGDYSRLAAALSELLERLSADIAAQASAAWVE